jgi:hypothetical protein
VITVFPSRVTPDRLELVVAKTDAMITDPVYEVSQLHSSRK